MLATLPLERFGGEHGTVIESCYTAKEGTTSLVAGPAAATHFGIATPSSLSGGAERTKAGLAPVRPFRRRTQRLRA